MTLFRLIGEPVPTLRSSDLLTEDHPLRPYPPVNRIRTSGWLRAGSFGVALILTVLVAVAVYFAVRGRFTFSSNLTPMIIELVAAVVAYAVLTFAMEARVWPHELEPRRLLGLFKGMLLGCLLVSVCIGILALTGSYSITGVNPDYSPWADLLSMGVVAGVAEEILLRGGVFRLTEEGLGTWGAVVVSGLIFGFLHITNPDGTIWGAVAISIEAGILFAAIYALTRSLWWCIGVHFGWNMTLGPVFGSIVSGTGDQQSWFVSSWSGPEILTGGSFGLEASIVPVVLLGTLGVALLVYAQSKGIMISPIWARKKVLTRGPISSQ